MQGDLFIADTGNNVVREVNLATGMITTVAGDGFAVIAATAGRPPRRTTRPPGDRGGHCRRSVHRRQRQRRDSRGHHATGVITTVAGNGGYGYSGDGGPATAAELGYPTGVAVDATGDLFIADSNNNVIREVDSLPRRR